MKRQYPRRIPARRRRQHRAADHAAVNIRLAARLGELASLLRALAHRAGDIREELRRIGQNAVAEHERLILRRAAFMLRRPIHGLKRAVTYIDRRGAPREIAATTARMVDE
ncbi:hypothetical protein [Sorangium sp. So ce1389]|uniref:hypothetical protein n=1 Tax=Sorangium sp. So ce1389 TaxID=3133336 RepID=UPI003F63BAB1